jgi:hypothetical protein
MAVALGKKSNAADGRFGLALWGLQAFPISALSFLDGRSARLQKDALTSEMPDGQRLSGLNQRFPRVAQLINVLNRPDDLGNTAG